MDGQNRDISVSFTSSVSHLNGVFQDDRASKLCASLSVREVGVRHLSLDIF